MSYQQAVVKEEVVVNPPEVNFQYGNQQKVEVDSTGDTYEQGRAENSFNLQLGLPQLPRQEEQKTPAQVNDQRVKKPRQQRTHFKVDQLLRLENFFQKRVFISRIERIQLAHELNLHEKQIKIWFQNRRMKHKKDSQPRPVSTITSSMSSRYDGGHAPHHQGYGHFVAPKVEHVAERKMANEFAYHPYYQNNPQAGPSDYCNPHMWQYMPNPVYNQPQNHPSPIMPAEHNPTEAFGRPNIDLPHFTGHMK